MTKKIAQPSFIVYLVGQTLSSVGDGIYVIAFIWLSLKLSCDKGLVLGGIFSLYASGELLFGIISGSVVDRFNKKKVLMIVDFARGAISCMLYVIIKLEVTTVVHLYATTLIFAILSPFFHRAEFSILPEIIQKSQLLKANGLLQGMKRLMRIISPAIGGLIIHLFGTESCFLFDGLSFFCSMLCVALVKVNIMRLGKQSKLLRNMLRDIRNGSLIVFRSPFFLTLSIYAASINFFGAPVFPLLPIISEDMGTGASGYGVMMSALSAGLITASFLISYIDRFLTRIRMMLTGICVSAVGVIGVSLGQNTPTVVVSCFMIGAGLSMANIPVQTILQVRVPSENLGVVSGFVFTIAQVAMPISMALSGFIVRIFDVTAVLLVISTLMLLGAVIGFFLPQLKQYA